MAHKALLCGINAYTSIPLRGCVNDVHNLQQVLLEHYGFLSGDVRLLLDEACIKSRLLDSWRWLTDGAAAGDVLVFHISAHGSYVPDQDGEEEDLRDEITCLQNFDFDNPDSYITDDEWYQLIQAVDPAVHLLLVKDTCHSGGSSRFISVRQVSGIDKIILANTRHLSEYQAGDVIAEESLSNARFIVPPNLPAEAWQHRGSTGRSTSRSSIIHTNLMACSEAQTAADAYIEGEYQGAFTQALCAALRQNAVASTDALIQEVAMRLRNKYEQVPQHEGRPFALALLASSSPVERPWREPMLPVADAPLSPQQMVYSAHMHFLDTMCVLQGPGAAHLRESPARSRVLVAVHGIGNHPKNYSDDWWRSLQPHVGDIFNPATLGQGRAEVRWSDLVNQQRSVAGESLDAEAQQLRQAILDVIDDRRLQQSPDPARTLTESVSSRGIPLSIDDFLVYMLNADMRRRILARFTDVVRPLLAMGAQLELVSHSWGTVVAYEGLRELDLESGLSGRVNNWFTVGSALSIPPVQSNLRPGNRPSSSRLAPKPALVNTWINLDAKGDLVGGALGHRFAVSREYLNLVPTGCSVKWTGYDLGCAHGSYFQPGNSQVNRDIFAAHILGRV